MSQINDYQKGVIFACWKNGFNKTETHKFLVQSFGQESVSYDCVKWWVKEFNSGRVNLTRKEGSGRPVSEGREKDLEDVKKSVKENPFQSIREISLAQNVPRESVRLHLHKLQLCKKRCRFIPRHLTPDLKARRLRCAQASLQLLQSGKLNIQNMITIDEKSFSLYTKFGHLKSKAWQKIGAPRLPVPKSLGRSQATSQMYAMAISTSGVQHVFRTPAKTTVNANVYMNQILKPAIATFKKQRRNRQLWLLHDNARPHVASVVKTFLADANVSVIDHPPYSPDLSPCDYFLFSRLSKMMAGKKSDNLDQLFNRIQENLQLIPNSRFEKAMLEWRQRLELTVTAEGDFFDENLLHK